MAAERRNLARKNFSYYMRVVDDSTDKLVGHISDISSGGFKLDSNYPVPLNKDIRLRIDHTGEIASKTYLIFVGRATWCQSDLLAPGMYNVGFKIVNMTPADYDIFLKMFNEYSR
ncbi:MAG TPA: PilZ domain-containing protein [Anaerolineales bacterium]|nr:PilZ domain-containing protein [Chloroflexota bacterium]MDP1780138.1 PilZ domain-containing protein [Anaerolineales bacterium]HLA87558.1 PilZ domain-containing protein [Anaerolineales bacterium]